MFKGDEQILHFLHCERTFKDNIICEGDHDEAIKEEAPEMEKGHSNDIPRYVVRMEH